MRKSIFVPLLLVGTAVAAKEPAAVTRPAQPQRSGPAIELSSGVEYEEGDYGTGQKLRMLSVPNTIRVASGRLQLTAALPYKRVEGPGNVVAGSGLLGLPIIVDPTRPGARTRRQGMGDLTLGASYGVPMRAIDVTLSGEVKLPTASHNLGTGKVDYAVGADISKTLGKVIPFAGVSYTMPGEPEGYALRNSVAMRGGVAAQLGRNTRAYVAYSHAQNASRGLPDDQRVTSGVNAAVSNRISLGLYGAAGLSKSAPDVGAGVRLGVRLQ